MTVQLYASLLRACRSEPGGGTRAQGLTSPIVARRRDILEKYEKRVMEEAPYAYKAIEPVVDSIADAGIAHKVARLIPLCTVKG